MPQHFRLVFNVLAMLACGIAAAHAQSGVDRPGGDYSTTILRSGDPAQCAARCEREGRCKAWSFSYPAGPNWQAMCRLKSEVPARTESQCCVSGVRGAGVIEPRLGAVEYSTDRLGGDYRNIPVAADPAGATCMEACKGDPKCRAWTYARPGYFSGAPRCFLKDKIKPPRRKPCCISGVVR